MFGFRPFTAAGMVAGVVSLAACSSVGSTAQNIVRYKIPNSNFPKSNFPKF